ncbi:MAG: pyridine nucleotide-disulfide oxidoreductase [Pseudozobellia sp.]|nr:pyridine nucleotide-disulfide oxidoreductase [Pseudozobellia sp.]MBG47951.1 pyridine nucleotide-disulfide oxidoreductase [Pseudozobellia sp.]|tara:strand:- start:1312 stop:2661 length:1350 start_codon:yes stop_codon:yes gene_type:complete
MEGKKFDVFVIGSGVAGQTVALKCAKAGMRVAIADNREFGGTCANRGCDPKKVLLAATEAFDMAQRLKGKGIEGNLKISWKKLQKFKGSFTDSIPARTEEKLREAGIKLYHQSPSFEGKQSLLVEGKKVKAEKIVVATGYEPRKLIVKGSKFLQTSDDFLNLKKLPKKIVFVGAGYIGMEFAHMACRAGSDVTIIDSGKRSLKSFDPDLVSELTSFSKKMGIEFVFGSKIESIKKGRKKFKLIYKKGGHSKELKADAVFNTAGRVPAISALDLAKGNVSFNENGIETNSYLQSKSNEFVYACGDVSDNGLPLTPLSGREGYIVAENILKNNQKKVDIPVIPSVVFTLPHLASVGYSEEEAKSRYKNVVVKTNDATKWFNAKRINASIYAYKIILNERTEEIVGAHLLGPQAAETINIMTMAINQKMKADELQATLFTYPSWTNDLKSMV